MIQYEQNLEFNNLSTQDVTAIINNEKSICYMINKVIVATPTESEVKLVEDQTRMSYSEYMVIFLANHNIQTICATYGATALEDIPVCVAMAIFDSIC